MCCPSGHRWCHSLCALVLLCCGPPATSPWRGDPPWPANVGWTFLVYAPGAVENDGMLTCAGQIATAGPADGGFAATVFVSPYAPPQQSCYGAKPGFCDQTGVATFCNGKPALHAAGTAWHRGDGTVDPSLYLELSLDAPSGNALEVLTGCTLRSGTAHFAGVISTDGALTTDLQPMQRASLSCGGLGDVEMVISLDGSR